MAKLKNKIKVYANQEVDFYKDVLLQNDGNGDYIKEWNLDIAKPTQSQLNALETQANAYEANIIAEQENKESKKQSAIAKLKALGLDEEEVKSIIGI
jgi:hypothetical protein